MNPSYNPSYNSQLPIATAVYASAPSSVPTNSYFLTTVPQVATDENGAREYLKSCKWPQGLQETFIANLTKVPIRFFICDDSGSMSTEDGHRLMGPPNGQKFVPCSRWAELIAALQFHATIAKAANAPTQFRLLNASQPMNLGDGSDPDFVKYRRFMGLLENSPSGGTPLCMHIREIIGQIQSMAPQLKANNQKACVIIATDGESSDGDIAQALKPLEHLPAMVVIRLCTDEEKIVNYWNNIDNDLELEMDVLDDLEGEAEEINEKNSWLTYGEPLHRLREFGIPIKEVDLLDERSLSLDQIRLFVSLLFGGRHDSYPHPQTQINDFCEMITTQIKKTGNVFNPISKRMEPWINVHKVKKQAGGGGGCIIL